MDASSSLSSPSGKPSFERSTTIVGGGSEEKNSFEFFGWVYHLGTNSIGHDYRHLRFLFIRGKYVSMYKRDPHENPGIIACAAAEEAQRWIDAFDHAKQKAEHEMTRASSAREKLSMETEINLEGHRPRVRRYAYGLRKLIRIGQGPETLLRQSSMTACGLDGFDAESGDAFEAHQWKCIRTMDGIRIFEDVSGYKNGKGVLVKSVGNIDASADTVFEVLLNTDQQQRYEWDMLMGDLELIDTYDGHYDVVYGTYDPKYLTRWQSKRDFIFSRQWFRGQDGTYTILQFPAIHKKKPPRSGYRRTKINPSTWEIRNLNTPIGSSGPRCLVTHTLEIYNASWYKWKNSQCSKFEKSIPYALLCQVAGLKEYIGANPEVQKQYATALVHPKLSDGPMSTAEYEDIVQDEFYDAIAANSSSEEESDDNDDVDQEARVKQKNITEAPDSTVQFDLDATPVPIDPSHFHGSLRLGNDDKDTNCWTSPSGSRFMIRGKNYLKDNSKVVGGDPLLKLIAVDWLKVDSSVDKIALHSRSIVQSKAGKKLPFILVINLQVPAKPNYSLVLYYAADRPVNKDSLLGKFAEGDDSFRETRFKLIPSIVEGYWMVKRAVGTKACLLAKAVTCKYCRQDNFLEIDVDIGSSSVARSVIGLVLGYVTSLVVDLAILIEAKEEEELPEFILGTVRLNRLKPDTAEKLEV
ncbi:protein ENHANCED DISEASE RESISTANCE 2 isoform X2 [Prosopis cineraria]|uniref:protein ENHANCED DISEASE RESISTANCE 2 isoform X2 n=1 Tax=Prosopis cineraria TaxID=364024 RepID=UPI00240F4890|nr:protein ENHANCED DISEASE RESISTANCE 2 isoform X2 [Prosopis cineraria]